MSPKRPRSRPAGSLRPSAITCARIAVWCKFEQGEESVVRHDCAAKDRDVAIQLPVGTLGDSLGWFPYAAKFQRAYGCRLTCVVADWMIPLFREAYPEIKFIGEDTVEPERYYATCYIGLFFDDEARVFQPCDFRLVGLHRTAGYILGVDPSEEPRKLVVTDETRPIAEPYVCIAAQSTTQAKYWEQPEWLAGARQVPEGARLPGHLHRGLAQPIWEGAATGDGVLLPHAEQGFGDTLQFYRFAPLAAAGLHVMLEVQRSLVDLLLNLPGVEQVVAQGDRLPPFDTHCPLLNLRHRLGSTRETLPRAPRHAADPTRVAAWRERLAAVRGFKVGLVWTGNPTMATDRRRSMTLDRLAPLGQVTGLAFVSLQKGPAASQAPPAGMVLYDWTGELGDFADTAALVEALDLLHSVDTSVVHLAGALGKPVWLLNWLDQCWRRLRDRDDSSWYPNLRQFRRRGLGIGSASCETSTGPSFNRRWQWMTNGTSGIFGLNSLQLVTSACLRAIGRSRQ